MVIIIRYNWWYYPIGSWASVECIESIAVIFLWPFGFTCEHIKNYDAINNFPSYSGSLYKHKTENYLFLHIILWNQGPLVARPIIIVMSMAIFMNHGVEAYTTWTQHVLTCFITISWMATRIGSVVKSMIWCCIPILNLSFYLKSFIILRVKYMTLIINAKFQSKLLLFYDLINTNTKLLVSLNKEC